MLSLIAATQVVPGAPEGWSYRDPVLEPKAVDPNEVAMLESERKDYAVNLSAFALARMQKHADEEGKLGKVDEGEVTVARKLVALALQMELRSKAALVANARLRRGAVPSKPVELPMTPEAFSSLLVGRAGELVKAGGEANEKLAGYFLDVAALLDPDNADALYALEIYRMDRRKVDWTPLLGGVE